MIPTVSREPSGSPGIFRTGITRTSRKCRCLTIYSEGFLVPGLMTNIREDKGYTYGIHSYLVNLIQESTLMISTEAGKDVSESTISEVYLEMKRLCEEPVTDEELKTSKNFMIGTLLGDLDGPFQVAGRWKSLVLNGLTEEYFYSGIETIKNIQPAALQELANKYLNAR